MFQVVEGEDCRDLHNHCSHSRLEGASIDLVRILAISAVNRSVDLAGVRERIDLKIPKGPYQD